MPKITFKSVQDANILSITYMRSGKECNFDVKCDKDTNIHTNSYNIGRFFIIEIYDSNHNFLRAAIFDGEEGHQVTDERGTLDKSLKALRQNMNVIR